MRKVLNDAAGKKIEERQYSHNGTKGTLAKEGHKSFCYEEFASCTVNAHRSLQGARID